MNLIGYIKGTSYKTKTISLAGLMVLVLLIVIFVSFIPTLEQVSRNNQLKSSIAQTGGALDLNALKAALLQVNTFVYEGRPEVFEQALFREISGISGANQTKLLRFAPGPSPPPGEWQILTSVSVLSGKYVDIVRTIFEIEKRIGGARVSGVDFRMERDILTRRSELIARVYIQSIVYDGRNDH